MSVRYLKLIPVIALTASAIFFASVRPSLAQIPTYYSDVVSDDCEMEPGTTTCEPGPVWMRTERQPDAIPTQVNQLQFLSPPPIKW
ncbi:hypothetical protein [Yersinia mollaretii]|uniref:hypothetical protein n=1 Tax=Yersinia mollaretii TaxID=33060 RepID=UPI0011A4D9B5|nr:hypothetical protein [Yersinia mollaretii]